MTDSVARDEADRYFSNKDTTKSHPEDVSDSDQHSDTQEKQVSPTRSFLDDVDDDDDDFPARKMAATTAAPYHIPQTFFEANTGPKGVIADAQAFDRAKKRSLRNTFMQLTSNSPFQNKSKNDKSASKNRVSEKSASNSEEDDDEFMEKWRQDRLEEMRSASSHPHKRRQSPGKRKWGFFKEVDANGYLDVVEKSTTDTVVVVCIYDPESHESSAVEASLERLAHKYATTRFIKLHHAIADMSNLGSPSIIAYKNGEVTCTLPDCVAEGLEASLRRNQVLVETTA